MLALGTQSVFEFANDLLAQPFYTVEQYALEAGGAWPASAPARSSWARPACSMAAAPPPTGPMETGFRDRRHLREAFVRGFGVPPQALRREARV